MLCFSLCVACRQLFVVCCLLIVVCCRLFVGCCLLVVGYFVFVDCCASLFWLVVSRAAFVVCRSVCVSSNCC